MAVFAGIDVGTGSARAGLFDATGQLLATAKHPIEIWREAGDIVEQSSEPRSPKPALHRPG
jgi:D-ribulokinase